MGPEKEIVIYEGLAHPVLCKKIRYYKDSYFTKRLLEKVEVKPLQLDSGLRGSGGVRVSISQDPVTLSALRP